MQYAKQEHNKWLMDGASQIVEFENDVIILDLPKVVNDWKIVPRAFPQVYYTYKYFSLHGGVESITISSWVFSDQ